MEPIWEKPLNESAPAPAADDSITTSDPDTPGDGGEDVDNVDHPINPVEEKIGEQNFRVLRDAKF